MIEDVAKQHHYMPHGPIAMEPIQMMRDYLSHQAFQGYCIGNVIKYVSRYEEKDGVRDLEKARTYIQFLIDDYKDLHAGMAVNLPDAPVQAKE